jgi:hypothetical protein
MYRELIADRKNDGWVKHGLNTSTSEVERCVEYVTGRLGSFDADRIELWNSSFDDPGPDYSEYRLYRGGQLQQTIRRDGY